MLKQTLATCSLIFIAASSGAARPPTLDPTYGIPPKPLPAAEPIAGAAASWIWAAHTGNGQAAVFRRGFDLDSRPDHARLLITADNYFTAYVNGSELGGTAAQPGGYEWRTAHSYDVSSFLRPGRNEIALRGENADGAAGVVAVLQYRTGTRDKELVTDDTWKVSETLPPGWAKPDFDDSSWVRASVVAPLQGGPWASQISGWPGLTGGASYLQRLDVPVKALIAAEPGGGGIQDAGSIVARRSNLIMTPAPAGTPAARLPSVVLDFGQETSGRVEVTNGSGQPIDITLSYGESEDEARLGPYTGVQKITIPAGGVGSGIDSAFRYTVLTLVSGPRAGALIRRVRLNMDYYPVTYQGSFDCSEPLLTRIWYTGAYTARLCMQQDIWDAPKRDRARWMGDLHVSGEVINNVFLDRFLMEQTMDRLRQEAGSPPHGHVNGIPGYSCAWVSGMADFYRHTGDTDYIRRHHDDLIQMMDYFHGELDDRGVFIDRRGQWCFVDWSPEFNGASPHALAATHFFMVHMLREGAWLLKATGDPAAADRYSRWADEASAAAQQYLPTADGTFGNRWQDNAMAIYSGVASPQQRAAIWDKVLSRPYPVNEMITPYYNNYDIFAMSDAGHTREALQFVRDYWGGMLNEGATSFWEGYDTRWPKEHFHQFLQADNGMGYFVSLAHGWSTGAVNLLTERVLGVQSTGPGFETVEIHPDLCGLAWVSGVVPTPHGPIRVRCRQAGPHQVLDVDLPEGVTAAIRLGGRPVETFHGRHFHATA